MLLGNGTVLNKCPVMFLAGSAVSTETGQRASFQRSGAERNRFYIDQETAANTLWAEPSASYPPTSFTLLPQKGGWISSRNETWASFTASATGVRGLPGEAAAAFAITTNKPAGELVTTVPAGGAPADFAITTNAPLLTASINGAASAAFAITTNAPTLGAIASLVANASISVTTNAPTMYPLDDASPLRTASASFAISGALNRYAVGHMVGAALPYTELSPTSLASAVWEYLIEAGFSAEEVVRLLAAQAAGSATGLESANPQFFGLDGSTLRIDGTYAGGNRMIDSLNGA